MSASMMSRSRLERPPARSGPREPLRRNYRPRTADFDQKEMRPLSPRQVELHSRYGRGEAPAPEMPIQKHHLRGDKHSRTSIHTNVTPNERQPFKQRSSSCSFGLRTPFSDHHVPVGPGPLKYKIPEQVTRYGKSTTPSYSIGRRYDTYPRTDIPGPGEYSPETMRPLRGPAFTLLGRNRSPTQLSNHVALPAPNQYSLPSCIGTKVPHKRYAGAVRFNGRPKDNPTTYNRSPGPAQYALPETSKYKQQAPRASFLGHKRIALEHGSKNTPGPSSYSVERAVNQMQRRPPQFTFGVRHSTAAHSMVVRED